MGKKSCSKLYVRVVLAAMECLGLNTTRVLNQTKDRLVLLRPSVPHWPQRDVGTQLHNPAKVSLMAAPGPLALVGSGEYLPQMADVRPDCWRDGRPATCSSLRLRSPTGRRWLNDGATSALRRLNALAWSRSWSRSMTGRTADDPAMAAQMAGAGLIYLSGGDPSYLAGNFPRQRSVGRHRDGLAIRVGVGWLSHRGSHGPYIMGAEDPHAG